MKPTAPQQWLSNHGKSRKRFLFHHHLVVVYNDLTYLLTPLGRARKMEWAQFPWHVCKLFPPRQSITFLSFLSFPHRKRLCHDNNNFGVQCLFSFYLTSLSAWSRLKKPSSLFRIQALLFREKRNEEGLLLLLLSFVCDLVLAALSNCSKHKRGKRRPSALQSRCCLFFPQVNLILWR